MEAWERKILIFLQENECFCAEGQIVADGELGGQGGKTLRFLQEIVHFLKQRTVCWKPGSAKYCFSCRKIIVFVVGTTSWRTDSSAGKVEKR